MARISDTLLDQLVVIDESAGTEIVVPQDQWSQFLGAVRYLTGL